MTRRDPHRRARRSKNAGCSKKIPITPFFVGVVFLSLSFVATAQENDSNGSPRGDGHSQTTTKGDEPGEPSILTSPNGVVLIDATPVRLRLNRSVSSADSHVGDTVDFEVLASVSVNGILVIPKGAFAFGIVTEVQPTRKFARGGKLEIRLQYVKLLDNEKAALRAMQGGTGGGRVRVMTAAMVATGVLFFPASPLFLSIHGKDMSIPKGTELTAYIDGEMKLNMVKFQQSPAKLQITSTQPGLDASKNGNSVGDTPLGTLASEGEPITTVKKEGSFLNRTYTNHYFSLSYRLPQEWVLETVLIRNRLASKSDSDAANLLLVAVSIPQDLSELRADSSLMVLAVSRSTKDNTDNCQQYLGTLTTSLMVSKVAKQKGEISEYTIAGRDFLRENFEYRSGVAHRAVICSAAKSYLLVWKIEGSLWIYVDEAVSTTYAIPPWPPADEPESSNSVVQAIIPQDVTTGLLLRKVQPIYPERARRNHIYGMVRMQAVISQTGNILNLELLDGPIELAVSAVTAVRQWKFQPFLLNGEPVAVSADILINYPVPTQHNDGLWVEAEVEDLDPSILGDEQVFRLRSGWMIPLSCW
jgi:TonB family protein